MASLNALKNKGCGLNGSQKLLEASARHFKPLRAAKMASLNALKNKGCGLNGSQKLLEASARHFKPLRAAKWHL